jgi:hypothetical protein
MTTFGRIRPGTDPHVVAYLDRHPLGPLRCGLHPKEVPDDGHAHAYRRTVPYGHQPRIRRLDDAVVADQDVFTDVYTAPTVEDGAEGAGCRFCRSLRDMRYSHGG